MKLYEEVAEKLVSILEDAKEKGIQYPLAQFFKDGAFNSVTGKVYSRPENQFELGGEGEWLTFNQIKSKKGTLKKGSKAKRVYGYGIRQVDMVDKDGKPVLDEHGKPKKETIARYKYSNVFSIHDTDLEPSLKQDAELDGDIDDIIMDYIDVTGVKIEDQRLETRPRYEKSSNTIFCPKPQQFGSTEEYYAVFMPLLIASTGMNGTETKLAQEIGASMLMGEFKIDTPKTRENSLGIIQGFINDITENKYLVLKACNAANKAVRMIKREEAHD